MLALPPRELAEDNEPVMFCRDFTDSWNGFAPNVIRFARARFDEVPSRIREHVASVSSGRHSTKRRRKRRQFKQELKYLLSQ
jgi:hypothetical protein